MVRGAKAHQTGAVFSHEIVVLPTAALRPQEADYAVAFAVPVDTPGITHIVGRQSCDTRKLEGGDLDVGNARFGGHEALVVFDDVFVPWERVFLCGETEFAGRLVECFAAYHRQSYGGCKAGVGDVLIGAAALAAELTGVEQAGHIKRKLAEMVHLNETLYAGGIACSHLGAAAPSGAYLVDLLLANVCKQNVTRHPYEIARLAEDIAGGLLVTMPSEQDWRNPALRPRAGQVPARRGRRAHRGPAARPAAHREHDHGVVRRGLPHRVAARRRLARGADGDDRPAGGARGEEGPGAAAGGDRVGTGGTDPQMSADGSRCGVGEERSTDSTDCADWAPEAVCRGAACGAPVGRADGSTDGRGWARMDADARPRRPILGFRRLRRFGDAATEPPITRTGLGGVITLGNTY